MAPRHAATARPLQGLLLAVALGLAAYGALPAAFTGAAAPRALATAAATQRALRASQRGGGAGAARVALPATATLERPETTSSFDLTGKVVLVTGASRGIGAAIAKKLAEAGATVVGTATSEAGAEAISSRFEGELKGKGMKLDVVDSKEVEAVLKAITEEYGAPDILINNAGITQDGLLMRMKEKDWESVIDTNLNSVFRLTKGALKSMMKKRWGRVISISSVVGSMGNGGQANYAAAKAGMDGFSRALAREVASRGITVNTVAPGFIRSDMTDKLADEWKAKLLESVPVGRLGSPEEIAEAVLFLASPASAYVTGQTLHVNGGMHM